MKYLSVSEVAKLWNLNERRVRVLLKEGRIEGAILKGHKYLIPETATKPLDRRVKGQRAFEDSPIKNSEIDFKNYRKIYPSSDGYFGRYGGSFLPGVTLSELGQPIPLFSAIASTGIVGHPNKNIDVYGYFGMQESGRSYWGNGQVYGGYGSPYFTTAGCMIEGGTCEGSTHRIIEGTIGAWWRFFKGRFGTVESGVQLIYAQRKLWSSYDEPKGAKTDLSTLMLSFRYLPFQG